MTPTAIVDLTIAVFLCIIFVRRIMDRSIYKNKWQLTYCLLLIVLLVIDALALTLTKPSYPEWIRFVLSVISMFGAGLCIIAYTFYSETLLRENTGLILRIFRILEIVELIWLIALVYEGFANRIITFPDGIVNLDYSYPLYIDIIEFLILAAVPLIAIVLRKRIGTELAVLFGLFAVGPVLATVLFSLTDIDLSYALPSFTFLLMDEFIQKKHVSNQYKMLQEALTFTNFFLDTYVSAYYVNLEDLSCQVYKRTEDLDKKYPTTNNYLDFVTEYIHRDVHPEDRERLLDAVQPDKMREALKEKSASSLIFRDISDNIEKIYRLQLIRGSEENYAAFAFIDITEEINEQKERLREADEAKKLAESANKSKTEFLFNMSHDIRTPMNAIIGFTNMAAKHIDDRARVLECLDKIGISGRQLLILINQVLEMARIESGKVEFEEKQINVRTEFNSMVTVLSEQAKANGLNFIYSLGNIEHNHIFADEARMSSITLNIAGNAMKYTPEGGTIKYDLKEIPSRKPEYATFVFTVADTGIGMSAEYLKELYEPFSREKSSTVSKIQGTGLGLSIVKSIIDLMGGSIEVQSQLGKGTRFDITVDFRINENAAAKADQTDLTETVSFKGRRVLLVEDNEMNREIAKDILEEHGLIVEDADDGDVAVAMVQTVVDRGEFHYYDFILMDVQMPRMNGYEATKAIRAIPGPDGVHIPIIAMTANAFEEDRQNALAAGMDEHLAKPIDVRKALRTIARFLG